LVMEGALSDRPTECRYCRYPAIIVNVAMATIFLAFYIWLHIGAT